MRYLELVSEDQAISCDCCFPQALDEDAGAIIQPKDYNLQSKYDAFNQKLFGGELPTIPISYRKLGKLGGVVAFKVKQFRTAHGLSPRELVPDSLKMTISTTYQRTELSFDMILLHEMIHVWQAAVKNDLIENHGPIFREKAKEIGDRVGYTIPLTDQSDLAMADTAVKTIGVILRQEKDGPVYAMISLKSFREALPKMIKDCENRMWHNAASVLFFEIATQAWTEQSIKGNLQRLAGYKTVFRYFTSVDLLNDLLENGKVVGTVVRKT